LCRRQAIRVTVPAHRVVKELDVIEHVRPRLFTAVFDPDDFQLDDPTYEYILKSWVPRTDKRVSGIDRYEANLDIGSTYAQAMSITPTSIILSDYLFKKGAGAPIGPRSIVVSRADLTYQIDLGHMRVGGVCKLEEVQLQNVF
jgi:hypothetical protein